ncbi:MAG TPA: SPW repeat protein [Candidatus Saccharimonadales bacterium]
MSYRFIPTKVHGALDYIVAIALIFAPMIFGFQSVGGAAVMVPMVLGIGLFLYSLLTDYEWGVIKVISMPYHLMIDIAAAVLLLLSPFIFGFNDEALNAWVPHVIVGIAVILVVICSQRTPATTDHMAM